MNIFDEVNKIIEQHQAALLKTDLDNVSNNTIESPKFDSLLTPKRDSELEEILKNAFVEDEPGETLEVEEITTDDIIIAPEHTRTLTAAQQKPVKLTPRPYQEVGIEFLQNKRRAILSDQAGLGKTLQAAMAATPPVLVIAPTYLTEQWFNFLCAQFPALAKQGQIVWAKGSRMKRIKALKHRAQWTVINIQMLRTFHEYINPKFYRTIVIDEAHHIRNRKATQSKIAADVCADMKKKVFLLTATPIWKDASNLWMLLHTLYPSMFDSYEDFVEMFCETEQDYYEGIKVVDVKRSMTRALNELLSTVKLGRSYKDAGRTLPPVNYHFIRVDMPKELKQKYDELKRYWMLTLDGIDDASVLFNSYAAVLHSLRALSAFDGKMSAVMSALEDTAGAPGAAPATVFCWYKSHAYRLGRAIQHYFKGRKKVAIITGDTKASDRPAIALDADIVVATIGAMSEGVNLYHHRTVIYFEENWVPGSNYQSLSRVRRDRNDDGEDVEPVEVYYIHTRGTIDEHIHKMTQAREGSIRRLIQESLQ